MEFGNESVPINSTLEITSKVNELEQTPFIVDTTGVLSHGSDLTTGIPVTSDNTNAEDILFYKDENGLVYFAEDSNNIVFLQQDQDLSQFIADGNYQQVVVSEANDHGIIITDDNGYQTVVTGTSNDQNVAIVNNNEYQIVVSESNDQATPTIYNSPQTVINEQNELTANNITNHAIENSEIKYCEQEINTTFQYDDKILASKNYVEETTILNNSEQGTECTQNSDLKASITTTEYPDATSGCNLPETAIISNQNQETVQPEISTSGSDNNDVIAHESVALENNQQEAVSISDGDSEMVTTLPNLEANMTNDIEHEILTAENNDQQLNTISGYDHSSAEIEKICLDTSTVRSDSNEKIITPSEHQIVVNQNNQNGDMTNSPNHDQEIIGHSNDSSHDINLNGTRSEGINLIDNDNNGEMTVLSKEHNLITISNDVGQKHDESQIIDRKTPCELSVPEISNPEPIKIDALHQEKDFNDSQDCVISKINNDVDNDPASPTVTTDDHKMKESLPVVKDLESHVIDEQTAMQDSDSQDTIEEIEYIVEEVIEFDDASQTEESETDSKAQDSVISNDDERLLSNYSGTLDLPRTNKLRIKEDILFSKSGVRKPLRTYERKNKSAVPQKLDNGVHGMQELSKRRSTFKDDGYSPDSSKSSPRTSHKPSPLGQRESVRVYGAPKKQPSSGSSLNDRVQRSPNKCKYDEVKLFEELEDHSPNHETNMSLHAQHIECMNLTEDSACIDLESTLSPTKKKGRPPKMKSPEMKDTSKKDLQASYTETDSMLETDVNQTTPVSTSKKRRGRPPRVQHDIESTPHQLGELKTSSVQIRDSPTSHSILSESITDIVDQEVSVVDSPTPKKRGRKPKIASGLNSSVEESFSARTPISAVSLPNKRRGRPPKEISDRAIISVETSARAPRSSGADKHESSPAVPNVSSPAKKRRGRPPRVSLIPGPDPSTDQPIDSIIHAIEPNSHPVSDDTPNGSNVLGTDTHEIPTNDNNENVDNVRTLKRKRGRQSGALPDAGELLNASKTKESLEISAIKGNHTGNTSAGTVTPVIKRRGRPPKARNSLNESMALNIKQEVADPPTDLIDRSITMEEGADMEIEPITHKEVEESPPIENLKSLHAELEPSSAEPDTSSDKVGSLEFESKPITSPTPRAEKPPKKLHWKTLEKMRKSLGGAPNDIAEERIPSVVPSEDNNLSTSQTEAEDVFSTKVKSEPSTSSSENLGKRPKKPHWKTLEKRRKSLGGAPNTLPEENIPSSLAAEGNSLPISQTDGEKVESVKITTEPSIPRSENPEERPKKLHWKTLQKMRKSSSGESNNLTEKPIPILPDSEEKNPPIRQIDDEKLDSSKITSEPATPCSEEPEDRPKKLHWKTLEKMRKSSGGAPDNSLKEQVPSLVLSEDNNLSVSQNEGENVSSLKVTTELTTSLSENLEERPKELHWKTFEKMKKSLGSAPNNLSEEDTSTPPASEENSLPILQTDGEKVESPEVKSEPSTVSCDDPEERPKKLHWKTLEKMRRSLGSAPSNLPKEHIQTSSVSEEKSLHIRQTHDEKVESTTIKIEASTPCSGNPEERSKKLHWKTLQKMKKSSSVESNNLSREPIQSLPVSEENNLSVRRTEDEKLDSSQITNEPSAPCTDTPEARPKKLHWKTLEKMRKSLGGAADSLTEEEILSLAASKECNSSISQTDEAELPPKKRGRKPKVPVSLDESVNTSTKQDSASPGDAVILHAVPPQKRRGRQQKHQTSTEVEFDSENRDRNSLQMEIVGSRRGQSSKDLVPGKESLLRNPRRPVVNAGRSGGKLRETGQATKDLNSLSAAQTIDNPKKRKRGRAAKVDMSQNESTEEELDNVIPSSKRSRKDKDTIAVKSPLKKRMGRPPKSEAKTGTTPGIRKNVKQVDSDQKVKRRGRPPKQDMNKSSDESNSNGIFRKLSR